MSKYVIALEIHSSLHSVNALDVRGELSVMLCGSRRGFERSRRGEEVSKMGLVEEMELVDAIVLVIFISLYVAFTVNYLYEIKKDLDKIKKKLMIDESEV